MLVAPGLTLRRIPDKLTVFDLAAAGSVGFREWALLEPILPTCTVELESAKEAAVVPGYDHLNRGWLISSLLLLRGFGEHLAVACASYSWLQIAGHQKRTSGSFHEQLRNQGVLKAIYRPIASLPEFSGGLLDFHVRLITLREFTARPVTVEDAKWLQEHFDAFNELCTANRPFRLALEALADCRYSQNSRVAIARLWSGIESLFSVSAELVYRISIVGASLLTDRGKERIEKFSQLKKLYGLRSKAVHGEHLSDESLADAVDQSFALLRDLLLVALKKRSHFTAEIMDNAVMGN